MDNVLAGELAFVFSDTGLKQPWPPEDGAAITMATVATAILTDPSGFGLTELAHPIWRLDKLRLHQVGMAFTSDATCECGAPVPSALSSAHRILNTPHLLPFLPQSIP